METTPMAVSHGSKADFKVQNAANNGPQVRIRVFIVTMAFPQRSTTKSAFIDWQEAIIQSQGQQ